jgi:DNA-binding CsgD family transcriptional regulator
MTSNAQGKAVERTAIRNSGGRHCLPEEERSVLTGFARRRKTAQALALRARIVLLSAEGGTIGQVAEQVGTSRNTASKWRSRFLADRL